MQMKQLSKREKEVLILASNGDIASAIASKLFISARTVDSHIKTLKNKLGAKNIQHAVRLGIIGGYIDIFPVVDGRFKDDATYPDCKAFIAGEFVKAIGEHVEQNGEHVDFNMSSKCTGNSYIFSNELLEAKEILTRITPDINRMKELGCPIWVGGISKEELHRLSIKDLPPIDLPEIIRPNSYLGESR
jgi:DNA-binding CsgD family transcriptional regulator